MNQARLRRIAGEIKKEIGKIIQDELHDPRIGFVTVTRVDLSADLRLAKIYYSLLGNDKQIRSSKIGIARSRGFIRKLLGQRMKLRYIPELVFKLDKNIEYSIRISKILEDIKKNREKGKFDGRKPSS